MEGHNKSSSKNKLNTLNDQSIRSISRVKRIAIVGVINLLLFSIFLSLLSVKKLETTKTQMTKIYDISLEIRYETFLLNVEILESQIILRNIARTFYTDERSLSGDIGELNANIQNVYLHYEYLLQYITENHLEQIDIHILKHHIDAWYQTKEDVCALVTAGERDAAIFLVTNDGERQIEKIEVALEEIIYLIAEYSDQQYAEVLSNSIDNTKRALFINFTLVFIGILICMLIIIYIDKAVKQLKDNNHIIHREIREKNKIHDKYINSIEASDDVIFEIDYPTSDFFASSNWIKVFERQIPKAISKNYILGLVCPEDRHKINKYFDSGKTEINESLRIILRSGYRWVHVKGKIIREKERIQVFGAITDVTDFKEIEKALEYTALHDSLTSIPNRLHAQNHVNGKILNAGQQKLCFCMILLDLDNFKQYNDGYGHAFGDKILQLVAQKLQSIDNKKHFVSRLGGDEFLLIGDISNREEDSVLLAERIQHAFDDIVLIDNINIQIAFSAGICTFPADGSEFGTLLKKADTAMYESKSKGKKIITLFNEALLQKTIHRTNIRRSLTTAIDDRRISMVYQLQYDPKVERFESMEALMRISDNNLGKISPSEFIPIAEETNMIVSLGYWSLQEATNAFVRFKSKIPYLKSISVNVSDVQLRQKDFVDNLMQILSANKFPPHCLKLEITENVLLEEMPKKSAIFKKLQKLGIKIELDDFGTGYSSLNYLRQIPFDSIKIDKCFVDEIGSSSKKEMLIEFIVDISNAFSAISIAEGVENKKQADFLIKRGIQLIQGYYYAKPLPEDELLKRYST